MAKIGPGGVGKVFAAADAALPGGMVMGAVPSTFPEQVSGRAVDDGSDIFSLGIIDYWIASGGRLFPRGYAADPRPGTARSLKTRYSP